MKVRPVFYYLLAGVLMIALGLNGLQNIQSIKALRLPLENDNAVIAKQGWSSHDGKVDTVDFLTQMSHYMEASPVTLQWITTETKENRGYYCQMTLEGTYDDLMICLDWLEQATWINKVEKFRLLTQDAVADRVQLMVDIHME